MKISAVFDLVTGAPDGSTPLHFLLSFYASNIERIAAVVEFRGLAAGSAATDTVVPPLRGRHFRFLIYFMEVSSMHSIKKAGMRGIVPIDIKRAWAL